ncbi:MAG: bacillithiol biosynthesis deacetylase BshB1 [Gemmatimonadota bacterium]
MNPPPLDVLVVMAHPDDAELLCGGTLLKCADLGQRTGVLDLTRGESGTAGSVGLRAQEAARAATVLGLTERRNAELPDARLENDLAARLRVAALLRELRPTIVITHWPVARHPDHRVAAEIAREASFLAGLKGLELSGVPHRPRSIVHALAFHDDAPAPTFVVDITEQIDRKIEVLRCYASQFDGRTGFGGVHAGGDRALYDQVQVHAARDGARIRRRFGEPFWIRETLELDSPLDVTVPTF